MAYARNRAGSIDLTTTTPAAPIRKPPADFADLLKRAESGELIAPTQLVPFMNSGERSQRGLAKRLASVMVVRQAHQDAALLSAEAAADLDFRYPQIIAEAVNKLTEIGEHDRAFNLHVDAAAECARRGEWLQSLIYNMNAAAGDFPRGARNINNPAQLRRLIDNYGIASGAAAKDLKITPSPRHARRSPDSGKLRMAHITCQLVDGDHSPSRCIDTLLRHADTERFDHYLVLTEALGKHASQPDQRITSPTSAQRAPKRIEFFQNKLGIPVLQPRAMDSFAAAAADLHTQLREHAIDIAFYHGSIATPTDWLLCSWRAAPWQFDRGFGLPLFCPHNDYQFFEFEETMESLAFFCRDANIPYGYSPFGSVDLSASQNAEPLDKSTLSIPADHVVLGTIGNHLTQRMSPEFCRTISQVLRAEPNCTYIVIGPGDFTPQAKLLGMDLCTPQNGQPPRIRFAGPTDKAASWTRTLDIYVNEYPEGGGISVCEAMACERPVVAMQVGQSSLALVGGNYVGPEQVVTPATNEAYAERLISLIRNPDDRIQRGQALRARYESEFNGRKWAIDMSQRIARFVETGSAD